MEAISQAATAAMLVEATPAPTLTLDLSERPQPQSPLQPVGPDLQGTVVHGEARRGEAGREAGSRWSAPPSLLLRSPSSQKLWQLLAS
jgi:hypothetical protein